MKFTPPSQEAAFSQNQTLWPILCLMALAGVLHFWLTINFSPVVSLLAITGVAFFFVSFFFPRAGLVLMTLSMLFSPEISVGTVGVRAIALRLEDFLIPLLLLAWMMRLSFRKELRLFTSSPLNLPIVLLLGLSVLSTVRGIGAGWALPLPAALYIFKTAEFFLVFFLVLGFVRTEQEIKLFLGFSLAALALIGIYTLSQVPSVEIFTEHRITAPFEGDPEPGTIGGYMAFLLLILLSLFLYEKRSRMKWIYGLLGLLVLIPFLYTLNRTSYVALIGGVIFISFAAKKKWIVFSLFLFLIASPFVLPKSVKERIVFTWEDARNPGRELGVDSSAQGRIYTFRKMWKTWKQSPLIGWGVGSFETPDSQYARTLHEIGIIGLGLWLWIFWRLYRISRWLFYDLEEGTFKGLVLGYWAGLLGILLHGFGAITFYIVRIMEPFWFMSGLVVSLYLIKSQKALSVNQ